jgi:hypothetical protein
MKNEGFGVNEPDCESRELVPLEKTTPGATNAAGRPLAAFLVQLLACRGRLALFRIRRRAKPQDAHALYTRDNQRPPRPRFDRKL